MNVVRQVSPMRKRRTQALTAPERMTISVVVPTYMRVDDLSRCIAALDSQLRVPDEVIVVWRAGDEETERLLAERTGGRTRIRGVCVDEPGQVAALNVGLQAAAGDIVAFTDDDAAPFLDWLLRIEQHFKADGRLGGVGGRDYWDGVHRKGNHPVVGRVQWFGRCIGFHHEGVGEPRNVEILKGANMSFRRGAISNGFDRRLRGDGAQVANDLKLALEVRKQGWTLVYDPNVAVDHYLAVRHDDDKRTYRTPAAQTNASHNQALALLDYLSLWQVPVYLAWTVAIGSREVPGIAQVIRLKLSGVDRVGSIYWASLRGTLAGIRTWLRR